MLSFKKWLEATGAARVTADADLIDPPQRIKMTGTGEGGVPTYRPKKEDPKRKEPDPDKLFGVKKIERQSKK